MYNCIMYNFSTNKQKQKLQVLTLPKDILYVLTALHFHFSIRIFVLCSFVWYSMVFSNQFVPYVWFQTFGYF